MLNELAGTLFPFLIGVVLVASPAFVIGYWTGVEQLRNRQAKMTLAIEKYEQTVKEWKNKQQGGNAYWEGYAQGVEATLKALYTFLGTFGDKKHGPK